jgi:hypothetical protein
MMKQCPVLDLDDNRCLYAASFYLSLNFAKVPVAMQHIVLACIMLFAFGFQQFLGSYDFKSKTHQDACCPEGMCRAAVFALHVKEELNSWPEQSTRQRTWLTVPEAASRCRYQWMEEALLTGFSDWHDKWSIGDGGGGGANCVTRPNC